MSAGTQAKWPEWRADEAASSVDYQQRRGRMLDIIDEAIAAYDGWMLDDDFDATTAMRRIIERMRERRDAGLAPAIEWRDIETAPRDGTEIIYRRKDGQVGRCRWDAGAYGEDDPAWWDIDADQGAYPDYWLPPPPPPVSP